MISLQKTFNGIVRIPVDRPQVRELFCVHMTAAHEDASYA